MHELEIPLLGGATLTLTHNTRLYDAVYLRLEIGPSPSSDPGGARGPAKSLTGLAHVDAIDRLIAELQDVRAAIRDRRCPVSRERSPAGPSAGPGHSGVGSQAGPG